MLFVSPALFMLLCSARRSVFPCRLLRCSSHKWIWGCVASTVSCVLYGKSAARALGNARHHSLQSMWVTSRARVLGFVGPSGGFLQKSGSHFICRVLVQKMFDHHSTMRLSIRLQHLEHSTSHACKQQVGTSCASVSRFSEVR